MPRGLATQPKLAVVVNCGRGRVCEVVHHSHKWYVRPCKSMADVSRSIPVMMALDTKQGGGLCRLFTDPIFNRVTFGLFVTVTKLAYHGARVDPGTRAEAWARTAWSEMTTSGKSKRVDILTDMVKAAEKAATAPTTMTGDIDDAATAPPVVPERGDCELGQLCRWITDMTVATAPVLDRWFATHARRCVCLQCAREYFWHTATGGVPLSIFVARLRQMVPSTGVPPFVVAAFDRLLEQARLPVAVELLAPGAVRWVDGAYRIATISQAARNGMLCTTVPWATVCACLDGVSKVEWKMLCGISDDAAVLFGPRQHAPDQAVIQKHALQAIRVSGFGLFVYAPEQLRLAVTLQRHAASVEPVFDVGAISGEDEAPRGHFAVTAGNPCPAAESNRRGLVVVSGTPGKTTAADLHRSLETVPPHDILYVNGCAHLIAVRWAKSTRRGMDPSDDATLDRITRLVTELRRVPANDDTA